MPHAAGAIVADELGRVLLVRSRLRRGWEYPAGGGESGETPESTCRREVFEETGLRLGDLVPLGESQAPSGRPFHTFFARIDAEDRAEMKIDRWEIAEARWVASSELVSMLAPHIRLRLSELQPRLLELGFGYEDGRSARGRMCEEQG